MTLSKKDTTRNPVATLSQPPSFIQQKNTTFEKQTKQSSKIQPNKKQPQPHQQCRITLNGLREISQNRF